MARTMKKTELEDKLYWYRAKVLRVVDGDTVKFEIDQGLDDFKRPKKGLRFAVADTPETYGVKKTSAEYAAGTKATNRTMELLSSGNIFLHTIKDKSGKYGRFIVEVYAEQEDGEFVCVNDLLIEEGFAEAVIY